MHVMILHHVYYSYKEPWLRLRYPHSRLEQQAAVHADRGFRFPFRYSQEERESTHTSPATPAAPAYHVLTSNLYLAARTTARKAMPPRLQIRGNPTLNYRVRLPNQNVLSHPGAAVSSPD